MGVFHDVCSTSASSVCFNVHQVLFLLSFSHAQLSSNGSNIFGNMGIYSKHG